MNQETVWTIETPKKGGVARDSEENSRGGSAGPENKPAWAVSLSLLVWGSGQFYNRRWKNGILFLLLMGNFLACLYQIRENADSIPRYAEATGLGTSGLLGAWCLFLFSGILVWILSAVLAFREAAGRLSGRYHGIGISFWPSVFSALIPGWGQFLNGQARKGIFFLSLFGVLIFSLPTILLVLLLWSGFHTEAERLFWEKFLIGLFLSAGAVIFLWPFVILDAAKVGLDEVKKEPFRKRIEYANNLRRMKGWIGGYFPQVKLTLTLALILALSVGYCYWFFPRQFYTAGLRKLEAGLNERKMVVIPELIDRIIGMSGSAMAPQKTEKPADPAEITQTYPSLTFQKVQHIEAVDELPVGENDVSN